MNTVKLVMLGEGGVGKTAISLRVAMNYFGAFGIPFERCRPSREDLEDWRLTNGSLVAPCACSRGTFLLADSRVTFEPTLTVQRRPADVRPHHRCVHPAVLLNQTGLADSRSLPQLVHTEDSYRTTANIDGQTYLLEILDTAGQGELSTRRSVPLCPVERQRADSCSLTPTEEYTALRDQWIRCVRA